jgi:hypothetical protein
MSCLEIHGAVRTSLVATVLLFAACEAGGPSGAFVIPGPTVPSPIPTVLPYVWDTDEELRVWTNNAVTRGPVPISLVGSGTDAFIRLEPRSGVDGWVLRGPDLIPPALAVRTIRIWYRWRLDPSVPRGAVQTFLMIASFEVVNPPMAPQQPTAHAELQPASDWTPADLTPGSFRNLLDIKYVYLHQSSANRGVFEIDRLELLH